MEKDSNPPSAPNSNAEQQTVHPPLKPVFYDEERRRWPWFVRASLTLGLIGAIGAILLLVSLIALPLMPPIRLPQAAPVRDFGNADPVLNDHLLRSLDLKQKPDAARLKALNTARALRQAARKKAAEQFVKRVNINTQAPIVAGFYVNWEQSANVSLHNNITSITHLIPEWLHLKPAGSNFADPKSIAVPFIDARQKVDNTIVIPSARANQVSVLPLINNYTRPSRAEEGAGNWDPVVVHEIVSNPVARKNVIAHLTKWLVDEKMQGINIDFEQVAEEDGDNLVQFMKELYQSLHPKHLLVTQDIQLDDNNYHLADLAVWNDWIVPMFYDEHAGGDEPGPIASINWTRRQLDVVLAAVPAAKVVMGVGNQAYDWQVGDPRHGAESINYQEAMTLAKETFPESVIRLDSGSLNPHFEYTDNSDDASGSAGAATKRKKHQVWMQDSVSVYNQLSLGKQKGIRGGALWFVGAEDPSLWTFYNKDHWKSDWKPLVSSGSLNRITYGGQGQVQFQGDGELLQPSTAPAIGARTISMDAQTGLITLESYNIDPVTRLPAYPEGWVVRRYGGGADGNPDKRIVLTFDDGPDPDWTPKILDILKQYKVPAVFFVVGKQAEEHPDLIRRMWDEGHEIGNHSWDHPDLYRLSPEHQRLELTTTERVIQAITGHSTSLFRPPYGGDVEPQTGREVSPMLTAADLHYVTLGEKNDPQDYRLFEYLPGSDKLLDNSKPRSYESVVDSVLANRDAGCTVLLHDAGGPRSNTVQALPHIIEKLRALGYTFGTAAELRHPGQIGKLTRAELRNQLMPPVSGKDIVLIGADRYVFEVSYLIQRIFSTLFTLSLLLGVSRVGIFVVLALIQRYREAKRVFPVDFEPFVSVIIAAYNEEKVVNRTINAILTGDYNNLEVIVVDDGSKDGTYDAIMRVYGSDPRVTALRKENGGKSTALNLGLARAKGEIFISLDADTLFAPTTISKLVRHFKDPKIGAVSGNVRVGNVHNIWTRWQALEYTTSQNFDRRSYDLLNCITVVPGAVGAMRREAVLSVGGYTHDTLAEDTDLTWKLRRAGWRIVNDNGAMAYTEAPETLTALAKQRYRWAFGTLQCLWKHRPAVFRHGAFGWIALPSLWLYQILFPAISPVMDIYLVYALISGNGVHVAEFYFAMFGIEFLAAALATIMDGSNGRLLPWLFLQKFMYRQLMYYVVLKSIVSAIRGGSVGWGKLDRTGRARVGSSV